VDVLLNIALFVPLGMALRWLGLSGARPVMVGLAVSLAVELLQATVIPGRDPSLSDLLTNTAGTWLGSGLAGAAPLWLWPSPQSARRLAAAASVVWLGMLAGTGWLLQPVMSPGTRELRWAPPVPFLERFAGQVLGTELNGVPSDSGLIDPEHLGRRLAQGKVSLTAAITVVSWPEIAAPVAEVSSVDSVAVVRLSQLGQKVLFSVRTRSADFLLRTPAAKVYRALPEPAGQAVTIGGSLDADLLTAFTKVGGRTDSAAVRISPGLGWALVLPLTFYPFDYRPDITSAVWTALPLLLVGYWGGRSQGTHSIGKELPSRATARTAVLGCAGLLLTTGLGAIPPLTGTARQGWEAWVACIAALLLGGLAARYASAGTVAVATPAAEPPRARRASSP